jgi:hypothetical protein
MLLVNDMATFKVSIAKMRIDEMNILLEESEMEKFFTLI